MSALCTFCGDVIARRNACTREACREAHARGSHFELDSRGFPVTRKAQPEHLRLRKAHQLRVLDGAWERIRAAAGREQLTIADFVERWALSLPLE